MTVLQSEIFHSSVSLFFGLTPRITMSFICFAHIKARRNPKSPLFFSTLRSPPLYCSPFSQLHTVWPVILHYQCKRVLIESQGWSGIKILASLERRRRKWRKEGGGTLKAVMGREEQEWQTEVTTVAARCWWIWHEACLIATELALPASRG